MMWSSAAWGCMGAASHDSAFHRRWFGFCLFASLSEDGGGDADVRGCVDAAGVVFPKVTQLVMDDILAGRGERLWGLIGVAAAAYLGRDGFQAVADHFEQHV